MDPATAVDPKDWSTLQARAALAGHQLFRTAAEDGAVQYFVSRWGMVKAFGSVEEVGRWLDRVEGRAA